MLFYKIQQLALSIESSDNIPETLKYVYQITQDLIVNNKYKNAILDVVLRLYVKHSNNSFVDITNCQFLLNNSDALSSTLLNILSKPEEPLIAYQIAFDLADNQNSAYLKEICRLIKQNSENSDLHKDRLQKLISILEGSVQKKLKNFCLKKMNKTDINIMKNMQKAVEKSGSVCHLAVVIANSLMNSHSSNDAFLKENMEWLGKATNWARFTAAATLGVIHMGNTEKGLEIMKPYLPGSAVPSNYAQAGGYYGLGLIYSNTNDDYIMNFLQDAQTMPNNSREVFQHGIFLAIGLVGMACHNESKF
jgi:26S proteasome regulatory subunit N2